MDGGSGHTGGGLSVRLGKGSQRMRLGELDGFSEIEPRGQEGECNLTVRLSPFKKITPILLAQLITFQRLPQPKCCFSELLTLLFFSNLLLK